MGNTIGPVSYTHLFRNVIMQSETVLIMGHKLSDFDAIGSAVGVYEAVESLGKKRFIVVREDATLAGELIEHIKCGDYPGDVFISPERAERDVYKRQGF